MVSMTSTLVVFVLTQCSKCYQYVKSRYRCPTQCPTIGGGYTNENDGFFSVKDRNLQSAGLGLNSACDTN